MASQTLASLVVKVGADLGVFTQGLTKAERQIKKFGDDLQGLGTTLTQKVGLPALGVVGYLIKVADSAGTMRDRLRRLFGESAKGLEEVIARAKQFGLVSTDALAAASKFAVFAQGIGMAKDQAAKLFGEMVMLVAELQQFYDVNPEEAFLALQRAMLGNVRGLKSLGLAVAASKEEVKKHEKAMDDLEAEMQTVTSATERWAAVQRVLAPILGTVSAEAEDISMNMRMLKAELETFSLALGEAFLPSALKAIMTLKDLMKAIVGQNKELAQSVLQWGLVVGAVGVFLKISGVLISNFMSLFAAVRSFTTGLAALIPVIMGTPLGELAGASGLAAKQVLGLSAALSGLAFWIGTELGKAIDKWLGISDAFQRSFLAAAPPVRELAKALESSQERWDAAYAAYEKLRTGLKLSGPEWEVANQRTRENALLLAENIEKASRLAHEHVAAAAAVSAAEREKGEALRGATEQVKKALEAHIELAKQLESKGVVLPILVSRGFDELKKTLKEAAAAGASGSALMKGLGDDVEKLKEQLALYPNLPVPEWFKKLGDAISTGAADAVLELAKHLDDVEPAAKKLSVKLVEVLGPDGEMHRAVVQSFEDVGAALEVGLGKRVVDAAKNMADGVIKVFDELGAWARTHPLVVPAQVAWDDPRLKELFNRWLDEVDRSWGR